MSNMRLVRCKTIRKTKPEQIKVGKLYWIDDNTKYIDPDGDEYAVVYRDADGTSEIGMLKTNHFTNEYRYLRYGLSLSTNEDTEGGNLLEDILEWCSANAIFNSTAKHIWQYIKDRGIDKPENMKREFLVKHIPFVEFEKNGRGADYMQYMGYYVVPNR